MSEIMQTYVIVCLRLNSSTRSRPKPFRIFVVRLELVHLLGRTSWRLLSNNSSLDEQLQARMPRKERVDGKSGFQHEYFTVEQGGDRRGGSYRGVQLTMRLHTLQNTFG